MLEIDCPYCGCEGLDDGKIVIEGKREDVKFARFGDPVEHSVSIIAPVLTCRACNQSWTDHYTEVIRTFAVDEARAKLGEYHPFGNHRRW